MKTGKLISLAAIAVCLTVLMLPDQPTDANLRRVFAERGLELISIEPSSGCNRVGAYRYAVRTRAGEIEHGLLCHQQGVAGVRDAAAVRLIPPGRLLIWL